MFATRDPMSAATAVGAAGLAAWDEGRTLTADVRVEVDGTALNADARRDLLAVDVYQDVQALSMFTLRLTNWDSDTDQVSWSDDALFQIGHAVTIQLGYADPLTTVIAGEITSLEPEFQPDRPAQLVVRGYDRGHRLARGHQTRSFVDMTDSDIASQVARDAGLSADVAATHDVRAYVLQHNQSDLTFLRSRAARLGYEVRVEDRTLRFGPPALGAPSAVTLELGRGLRAFHPRLNAFGQVSAVRVQGWSPNDKAAVAAEASSGDEWATLGATLGADAVSDVFGPAVVRRVHDPVFDQGEAEALAQAMWNRTTMQYLTGSAVAQGDPRIAAGKVVTLQGVGRRFGGRYYVRSTHHGLHPGRGYWTDLAVARNGHD